MNISIDINLIASEEITNSLLSLAAVLHNAVPIFNVNPKVLGPKEEVNIISKEVGAPKEKIEISNQEVKEITLQEVRSILAQLSKNGKGAEVKALIKKFGVSKLTEIPKEKYEQLLSEVEFIN
ncbi:hypothetical protein LGK97_17055 [Clostridium sp. CS001]|uniref:hypothetical protein n=1 Tax=Clostridium sp. CS001 TaxID=2880648 RepID=UPI001CF1F02B|nr:hypothetical protein [Clostridium sp. CS001]MCB2291437.1 hypothetical protein [Clostridium sp. CS001]